MEYRWIPGLEGRYDVSSDGVVRTHIRGTRAGPKPCEPRVLTGSVRADGVRVVKLSGPRGEIILPAERWRDAAWVDPEVWRPVVGLEGRYEVSTIGNVRSLTCRGGARSLPKVLSPSPDKDGYRQLGLRDAKGRRIYMRVSNIVLFAFAGPCPVGCEASHLNGNNQDDSIGNLAWESRKVNNNRRREHGTMPMGERNGQAKMTADDVRSIRADVQTLASIWSERLKVTTNAIIAVIERRTWDGES